MRKIGGLLSELSLLLLLAACGEDPVSQCPFSLRTAHGVVCPGSLQGTYRVIAIRCGNEESKALPDAVWSAGNHSIIVQYDVFSGVRTTEFLGCRQTVPLESIAYPAPGQSTVTEGPSTCEQLVASACDPFAGVCNTPRFTGSFPFVINGTFLTVTILDLGPQGSPCEGQPSPITFKLQLQ